MQYRGVGKLAQRDARLIIRFLPDDPLYRRPGLVKPFWKFDNGAPVAFPN